MEPTIDLTSNWSKQEDTTVYYQNEFKVENSFDDLINQASRSTL